MRSGTSPPIISKDNRYMSGILTAYYSQKTEEKNREIT